MSENVGRTPEWRERLGTLNQRVAEPAYWLAPQKPQRQDSLSEQVRDVIVLANRFGCYDAADWIKDAFNAA